MSVSLFVERSIAEAKRSNFAKHLSLLAGACQWKLRKRRSARFSMFRSRRFEHFIEKVVNSKRGQRELPSDESVILLIIQVDKEYLSCGSNSGTDFSLA